VKLIEPVRRLWIRAETLYRFLRIFSDFESIANYRRLRSGKAQERTQVRVRALHGQPVWLRPSTTDMDVFWDTFVWQFHVTGSQPASVLDLGSNIGLTAAHYASLFPTARVVCVEMDRENADLCRANLEPFGSRCEVVHGAVWSSNGVVRYAGQDEWGFHVAETGTPVASYTLSSLLDKFGDAVDLVKIDIEGAEREVFQSSDGWHTRIRQAIVEVHEPYTVDQCVKDLARLGFKCRIANRQQRECIIAER
jgi:FkbM family methyltransferase